MMLFRWLITSRTEVSDTPSRNGYHNSGRTFLSVVATFGYKKQARQTQATLARFLPGKGIVSHRSTRGKKKMRSLTAIPAMAPVLGVWEFEPDDDSDLHHSDQFHDDMF